MTHEQTSRYHGLLGTVVEVRIEAADEATIARGESALIDEVRRLERVFSVFDPESELSQWRRGEAEAGAELVEVLAESLLWQRRSGGAYNPEAGRLIELWDRGAERDELPDTADLLAEAKRISTPGYAVIANDRVEPRRSMGSLNLNAIAKGWIIDTAAFHVLGVGGVVGAMVNGGGDLLNLGSAPIVAGIEDPLRPYDNIPPAAAVRVDPGLALATSGGARRGWRIGGTWFSHVIDPRTGCPACQVLSASVIASSAAEADVLATILTVLQPGEGMALVGDLDDVECLLITADGQQLRSTSWDSFEVS